MQDAPQKSGSFQELAGVVAAAVLCGIALITHAQTITPRERKPAPEQTMVLADPDTKMYSVCTTGGEHEAPGSNDSPYKRPPKAEIITEEAAKARGFRPGAHKVACK
jgi:hypothetical protein